MMIPWILGGAVLLLVCRWAFLRWRRHENDRVLYTAIKNRHDLKRDLGDNE